MPTSTTATTSDRWLARINALLDKAESTDFPEEAEALVAKAQTLMARHSIDLAMLAAAAGRAGERAPVRETLTIRAPYASERVALLGAIARTNRCRVVSWSAGDGEQECAVFGYPDDVAGVRTMFTTLSFHALRLMAAAEVPEFDRPRRFRHAFLLAFAARIGERLRAAAAQAEQHATSVKGAAVGVALDDRAAAVERALREAFPWARPCRTSASSAAGYLSGREAADRAALGGRPLPPNVIALPSGGPRKPRPERQFAHPMQVRALGTARSRP